MDVSGSFCSRARPAKSSVCLHRLLPRPAGKNASEKCNDGIRSDDSSREMNGRPLHRPCRKPTQNHGQGKSASEAQTARPVLRTDHIGCDYLADMLRWKRVFIHVVPSLGRSSGARVSVRHKRLGGPRLLFRQLNEEMTRRRRRCF
jgi:hypothetical protein